MGQTDIISKSLTRQIVADMATYLLGLDLRAWGQVSHRCIQALTICPTVDNSLLMYLPSLRKLD
jgi:hypothetical protein